MKGRPRAVLFFIRDEERRKGKEGRTFPHTHKNAQNTQNTETKTGRRSTYLTKERTFLNCLIRQKFLPFVHPPRKGGGWPKGIRHFFASEKIIFVSDKNRLIKSNPHAKLRVLLLFTPPASPRISLFIRIPRTYP